MVYWECVMMICVLVGLYCVEQVVEYCRHDLDVVVGV